MASDTKLLIMASLFPPQKKGGGPTISIINLVQNIKNDFDIFIISKNHENNEKEPLPGVQSGWNNFDYGKVFYTNYGEHTFKHIIRIIKEVKPDVIYQNSFFSFDDIIPVLLYKKFYDKKVKIVIAPRGEICNNRVSVGGTKKKLYTLVLKALGLLKGVQWHATAKEEMQDIANYFNVSKENVFNVSNITSIDSEAAFISKSMGELKLVFIARIHPMKNVLNAIKYLKSLIGNVTYDIYGSVEDKDYWNICLKEISALPSSISVNYKGAVEHQDVSDTLQKYHAFFMPTIGENYGHSIVEALLNSKPVIISDQTPWTDINKHYAGYAIALEDEQGYVLALQKLINMEQEEYEDMCKRAYNYITSKIDTESLYKQYVKMFAKK